MAVTEPAGTGLRRSSDRLLRGLALGLVCWAGVQGPSASAQTAGPPALRALHDALKLDPQQEVAWRAYSDEVSDPTGAQARRLAAARLLPSLHAPQRMDLVEAELRAELQDLRVQSRALKAFYAALTAEQQHVFDARTVPPPDASQAGR